MKIDIIITFIICVAIGLLVAFSLQLAYRDYYGTTIEWDIILYGGCMLGCVFFTPLALLILADRSEKISEVKK